MLLTGLGLLALVIVPFNDNSKAPKPFCCSVFIAARQIQKTASLFGVHPNDNTATVWMKTTDLILIIKEHGNTVNIFAL